MRITVVSSFRNMAGRIEPYFARVCALQSHAGAAMVRVIAVEGDSTDGTAAELARAAGRMAVPLTLVEHSHGKRVFGSTEEPERLRALTGVMMAGMDAVESADDGVIVVESDLLWHPHQVGSVLDLAMRREGGFDVVAPMVFAGRHFYDTWGFRKGGERFGPFRPHHSALTVVGLTEMDSVGSCLAMRGEVARRVRPIGDEAIVSWCAGARAAGYRIAVAPEFSVEHPA